MRSLWALGTPLLVFSEPASWASGASMLFPDTGLTTERLASPIEGVAPALHTASSP